MGTKHRNSSRPSNNPPRFVYSSLPSQREMSGSRYPHVFHWDAKARIVRTIRSEFPNLASKMSLITPTAYMQRFLGAPMLQPHRSSPPSSADWNAKLSFQISNPASPNAKFPFFNVPVSTDPLVHALITSEDIGTTLLACDDKRSFVEVAELLSKIGGSDTTFVPCTIDEAISKYGFRMRVLAESLSFISEFEYTGGELGQKVTRRWELKT